MKSSLGTAIVACAAVGIWALTDFKTAGSVAEETEGPSAVSASSRLPASEPVVPSVSKTKAEPLPAKERWSVARARLLGFRECLQTQACEYPQHDPRSYEFAVHREWKELLKSLRAQLGRDPAFDREVGDLARESMLASDGHVQEEALRLMAALPPDPRNLEAVVRGLEINDADPLILRQAGEEMKRHLGGEAEERIHAYLEKTLRSGAHFTAEQAGILVRDLLRASSVERYRRVLREIPSGTTKARHLRAALSEYDARVSGG